MGGRSHRLGILLAVAICTACRQPTPPAHTDAGIVDAGTDAGEVDAGTDAGTTACAVDGGMTSESAWTSIGPAPEIMASGLITSGRTTAVALATATRWYVVSAGGGVWRTDDAGSSWTPLTDAQPTLAGSSIAL